MARPRKNKAATKSVAAKAEKVAEVKTGTKLHGKRKRVPFGGHRSRLQLSEEEAKWFKGQGLEVRWFNDVQGRINRAKAGGWAFVPPERALSIGGMEIGKTNSDLGSRVKVVVSRGQEIIEANLMMIPREYYDEDQVLKEQGLKATDEAIRNVRVDGATVEESYGSGVVFH